MHDDQLANFVRRANGGDRNGSNPNMMPPTVHPRPSGFRCPKCGEMAEQRVDPAPGTILGYKFLLSKDVPLLYAPDDERPAPVSVINTEIIEKDADGNPVKTYVTRHCLNCFNIWQRRQMMEDIRKNVPQLTWEGVPDADSTPNR